MWSCSAFCRCISVAMIAASPGITCCSAWCSGRSSGSSSTPSRSAVCGMCGRATCPTCSCAPLRVSEYLFAQGLSGVVKAVLIIAVSGVMSELMFDFDLLEIGIVPLLLTFASFVVFAFATGVAVLGLIFRFGTRIQALAWGVDRDFPAVVGGVLSGRCFAAGIALHRLYLPAPPGPSRRRVGACCMSMPSTGGCSAFPSPRTRSISRCAFCVLRDSIASPAIAASSRGNEA